LDGKKNAEGRGEEAAGRGCAQSEGRTAVRIMLLSRGFMSRVHCILKQLGMSQPADDQKREEGKMPAK
jgi:hypothetical protein